MTNLKGTVALGALLATMASGAAYADSFVNGDFETGDTSGWTVGGGSRVYDNLGNYDALFNPMDPTKFLPGGTHYQAGLAESHSAIIDSSYVDPHVGAALGSTVYQGNYSYRVEDTTTGGYASVISQTVANYTDSDIFFAWKAVLDGAHDASSSATMQIVLHDDTTNTDLITRTYNASVSGGGGGSIFTYDGTDYYTAAWQTEDLAIDPTLYGHTFTLTVLGSDCEPTGHWGYVYLDGFSNEIVQGNDAPEPASIALLGAGLAGVAAMRRRKKA